MAARHAAGFAPVRDSSCCRLSPLFAASTDVGLPVPRVPGVVPFGCAPGFTEREVLLGDRHANLGPQRCAVRPEIVEILGELRDDAGEPQGPPFEEDPWRWLRVVVATRHHELADVGGQLAHVHRPVWRVAGNLGRIELEIERQSGRLRRRVLLLLADGGRGAVGVVRPADLQRRGVELDVNAVFALH
jgi:hypothetical protein